jgi:hypothetical protein
VRHVALDDRDPVLLARNHLAQHHRLLHVGRDSEERALLAEPAQDAAGLPLDARRRARRDGGGARLLIGGGMGVDVGMVAMTSLRSGPFGPAAA